MNRRHSRLRTLGVVAAALVGVLCLWQAARAENLFPDPSFEKPMARNRWGHVFSEWSGNIYEGTPTFEVGQVAHTGNTSCEMVGAVGGKIRLFSNEMPLAPGRYRVQVWLRGLDIGAGRWGTTIDWSLGFEDKWASIKLQGTFGWTPVTQVFEVPAGAKPFRLFVGLWENGMLWVDDAVLEKVGPEVALTEGPVVGKEEAPIRMPGELGANVVRCPHCSYRNDPAWKRCYACGTELTAVQAAAAASGPAEKVFADFEDGKPAPFGAGEVVQEHATHGQYALRLDKDYTTVDTPLDFSQHDYLHFDVFNPKDSPVEVYVEIQDALTRDYWTRVNYSTVAPPGASTITMPTAIYVGEKSRPGRMLERSKITRFVVSVGQNGPIFLDNFRLERLNTAEVTFAGLLALDFGPQGSPLMDGFTAAGMGTSYSAGRGYGWTAAAEWWRDFNVLQPDALYQDFVCPRKATFRADLPDGLYHVWMNIDSPGGFWGEVQVYRTRTVSANGQVKVDESMDLEGFKKRYFRNASREDLPGIDTFSEYVEKMFQVKSFPVQVTGGKLELEFVGEGWAVCLSALVIYPDAKKVEGEKFLAWVTERRRAQFQDYSKQIVPKREGAERRAAGYVLFRRSFMSPAQAADGPREGELLGPTDALEATVAKGEVTYLTLALQPAGDLGTINVAMGQLTDEKGQTLAGSAFKPGWLDYRITRVTAEGSVYSCQPRYWHPTPAPAAPGVTRNFWVLLETPADAAPGVYQGSLTVTPERGEPRTVPVRVSVLPFALDPITDVGVGPWGSEIGLPWFGEDPAVETWDWSMFEKALDALKWAGASSFSGRPHVSVSGKDGALTLNTAQADKEMALIRAKGFSQIISNYGAGIGGYNMYGDANGPDQAAARTFGFKDAEPFLTALYRQLDQHAVANHWVRVAWNLCDEPLGDAIPGVVKNALAHRQAGQGLKLTTFMGATSMEGNDPKNDHYELVKALLMPSLNLHDEGSLAVIREAGNEFSFYNGSTRWTLGRYMKFLVKKHNLKLRLVWHLNAIAGDPYYALDCREDDYCWFNTNANGDLVAACPFAGPLIAGMNDYRYLSTLERLLKEKAGHPAAGEAQKLFDEMMDLKAGTDRDRAGNFDEDRKRVAAAIAALLR